MRIAIVNDMLMAVEMMRRLLAHAPEHQLAWVARDGEEAVRHCIEDTPDLILMDLILPGIDGVEVTRRIMARCPCAILIVTASVGSHSATVFEALAAGALDAVSTPVLSDGANPEKDSVLLRKIHILEPLIRWDPNRLRKPRAPVRDPSASRLIVIGASAGGPAALAAIFGNLPGRFPGAIVLVQHVDEQFVAGMASWLNDHSTLPLRVAVEGDRPEPGTILMAGTSNHLVFVDADILGYTPEPRGRSLSPSVDVFFESVARHRSGETAGILLTGMGRDGARGLKALRDAGALTIAQDKESSVVFGMPKAAIDLGAAMEILPLDRIAPRLIALCAQEKEFGFVGKPRPGQ